MVISSSFHLQFMREVWGVGLKIDQYYNNEDPNISSIDEKMKRKYDNYWGNINNLNMMLFIAILFDPRHKLLSIEWVIEIAYRPQRGNELQDKVEGALMTMFEQYSNVRKSRRNASLPKEKASGCSQLSQ